MIVNIKASSPELYRSEYFKTCIYKNNRLSDLKSTNSFSLRIDEGERLQLSFANKDSLDERANILIFSPVQFELDRSKNLFQISNKKNLKVQWNKYKEKNRSGKNNTFLFLYERLYFKIELGMEYDLMSNSSHLPFFVDVYGRDLGAGSVVDGMSWVHTPLGLPLKIEYVIEEINHLEMTMKGVISLDEENLTKLIADKQFQQQSKPYHYSKDFSIESEVRSVYDMHTGYLRYSDLKLKIYSEKEQINESIQSKISFL